MLRVNDALTGSAEKRILLWFCRYMPAWVTSDMLTMLGLTGAAMSFLAYWQSGRGAITLWLAILGLALNWFGDSLDGTWARHLNAERPRYGFFLDHMTDTFAMGLVAIGIGMSPYAHFASGLAVLAGYYLMVILSMVGCIVTGTVRISFNGVGPTEIRLLIIACTIAAILLPTPVFNYGEVRMTIYDIVMVVVTTILVVMCVVQTVKIARQLAVMDPPRR